MQSAARKKPAGQKVKTGGNETDTYLSAALFTALLNAGPRQEDVKHIQVFVCFLQTSKKMF